MSQTLPSTMSALLCPAPSSNPKQARAVLSHNHPLPSPRPDYALVKVHSVALNPTDWKHISYLATENAVVGCDCSGTIASLPSNPSSSSSSDLKVGDEVIAFCHGVNAVEKEDGCFAQYAMCKFPLIIKKPKSLSFEESSTFGVGISTVAQGLYQSLALPCPIDSQPPQWGDYVKSNEKGKVEKGEYVLIYGGSTATGTLGIQFAKMSGMRVLSVNSPHNDELVLSRGAEKTFDYSDAKKCIADIKNYTNDRVRWVFDCISEGSSVEICGGCVSDATGGKITTLLPVKREDIARKEQDVDLAHTLAYTVTGEEFTFAGQKVPASNDDYEFGKLFWKLTEKLLQEGKVKPHPIEVGNGGLEGVRDALEKMRDGKGPSGKKSVFNI